MKFLKAIPIILYASAMVNGALLYASMESSNLNSTYRAAIKKLEADVRTESGKRLDLEERYTDDVRDIQSSLDLAIWRAEAAEKNLDACVKKGK